MFTVVARCPNSGCTACLVVTVQIVAHRFFSGSMSELCEAYLRVNLNITKDEKRSPIMYSCICYIDL
jgi:hypothetical protein